MTTMNNQYKYQCNICDYVTSRKSQYERHITTRKHIMTTNGLQLSTNNYTCECGKEYSCRQNLYRHKQKCDVLKEDKITSTPNESPPIDSALIVELLKQNKELHEMVIDLAKNNNTTNNTTNNTINNTTNNKFNLNVYLIG